MADIKTVVLKTVSENTTQAGKVSGMWFLQYFVDGKSVSIKVVCGEKKIKDNGEVWYNAKGLSPKDFSALKPVYAEFLALNANPPAMPGAVAQAQDESDEVPF